jgi:hypothetical protein
MYACVRPQASRNSQKVLNYPPFMVMEKLPSHHWDSLVWQMRCAERCFRMIADHQVISHPHHVRSVIPFKTMSATSKCSSSSSKFYGGIAFGTNVLLCCHTDADFTISICQVFLKGKSEYHINDNVVVYFCFLTLGVAVPLHPGDYLMFNVLIPHSISSRCKSDDETMCESMYLKTAIVGMNNDDLDLTPAQSFFANQYHSYPQLLSSQNRQCGLKTCYQTLYDAL